MSFIPGALPDIIENLKAVPPNHVYALAPKGFVLRGYDYYSQGRLESYGWNADRTLLTAYVRGTRHYAVKIFHDHDTLRYQCNCPVWTLESHCKHVICTLLTTINLLFPDTFHIPGKESPRRQALEKSLLVGAANHQNRLKLKQSRTQFEVFFTDDDGPSPISIRKNGQPCDSLYGVPAELALLMRATHDPAWLVTEYLLTYLKQHRNTYPLTFESGGHRFGLKWDPSLHYETKTELNVIGDTVHISARCLMHGKTQEHARSFMGLIINTETCTVSSLKNMKGWEYYLQFEHMSESEATPYEHEGSDFGSRSPFSWQHPLANRSSIGTRTRITLPLLQVPINQFHARQSPILLNQPNATLEHLILKVNGKDASLYRPPQFRIAPASRYRLNLLPTRDGFGGSPSKDSRYTLQVERRLEGQNAGMPHPVFGFFQTLEKAKDLHPAFKAQKRKGLLHEAFFRVLELGTQSEVEETIKKSLPSTEFGGYTVKAEAKRLLKQVYEAFTTPDGQIAFFNHQWQLLPYDKAQEALLYAIPYAFFGSQLFRGMQRRDEMHLPGSAFELQLPDLHAKLKEAGIDLYLHHKPIVVSRWEFTIDAQHPPHIDWFELRPEIKCDGMTVDETSWREMLQRGSIIETDGEVRILDVNSLEILRSLSSIYPSKKATSTTRNIVKIPRLQILDWVALRKRGVTVRLSEQDESLIRRLTHFEKIEPIPLPKMIKAKLRPYQKDGYRWLGFLYQHRFGACLADDMGLGKTLQAISLLAGIKERRITPPQPIDAPHLIVLPPSLLFNWENEITRFYPGLNIGWYTGKERTTSFADADIVLTTYGLVRQDIDILEHIPFNVIIFDEAQAVKNIAAQTTAAARRLKGFFKLAMTGTPLENHLGEYYSLIDLCLPGLLGEYEEFKSRMKSDQSSVVELMLQRTKPFVLRRTKDQILKELPPKIETDIFLELTDRQKTLYQQTVGQIRPAIETAYRTKTAAQARIIALTAILKLRQVCLSPRLLHTTLADHSPKITCLLDRLKELLEEGHSALVFSQFTSFLNLVEQDFQKHGIPYSRLDGTTATPKRKKLVQEFQDGRNPSIFLLSLKAGGQGLNLTKASYVFHLDPWWNPAVENQASDRAHRIGQQSKVSVMRLLMRHTIEEKMMELKQHKLALYEAVMDGSTRSGTGTSITKSDFDFLLG